MAGFLYFTPGAQSQAEATEKLIKAGAGHAVEKGAAFLAPATIGGVMGAVVAAPVALGREQANVHKADAATWQEAQGGYSIGFEPNRSPTPEDLARPRLRMGHYVTLLDGNAWRIPVARYLAGNPGVPRVLTLDVEGKVSAEVSDTDEWLWDAACQFWDEWMGALKLEEETETGGKWVTGSKGGGKVTTNAFECFHMATKVIGVNYRLTGPECSALGLFSAEDVVEVLQAMVDWPALAELEKKQEADESSTTLGDAD